MKLDAMSVAALAVAGLAVYAFTKTRNAVPTASSTSVFGLATAQRQDSGAALAQNTDYLREWSSPMADTLFSNGSLGD